jgi:hypothetical protein
MFVFFVFVACCVGSGLCGELITRSEESYRLCSVCDLVTSIVRWPRHELRFCTTENK